MNAEFVNEMKQMQSLTDEDRQLLAEMHPAVEKHAQEVVDTFYTHLDKFEVTRDILNAEPGRVERLKGHLKAWLNTLTEGVYEEDYFKRRYRIGKRHVEVGLEPRYVIAAMAFCRATASKLIIEAEYADDPQRGERLRALDKVMDLDLNIMLQSYDDQRLHQFLEVTGFSRELFETLMAGE